MAVDARGYGVLCSGTHPFSSWAQQTISPNPRYMRLVQEMRWVARDELSVLEFPPADVELIRKLVSLA